MARKITKTYARDHLRYARAMVKVLTKHLPNKVSHDVYYDVELAGHWLDQAEGYFKSERLEETIKASKRAARYADAAGEQHFGYSEWRKLSMAAKKKKPAARKKSTAKKKPAAKKPAAKKKSTAKKPAAKKKSTAKKPAAKKSTAKSTSATKKPKDRKGSAVRPRERLKMFVRQFKEDFPAPTVGNGKYYGPNKSRVVYYEPEDRALNRRDRILALADKLNDELTKLSKETYTMARPKSSKKK